VALKTIHPGIAADTRTLERFEREVQLARKVTHPNVGRMFDLGTRSPPTARGASPSRISSDVRVEMRRGEGIALEARDGIFATPLRGLFVRAIDGGGQDAFAGSVSLDSECPSWRTRRATAPAGEPSRGVEPSPADGLRKSGQSRLTGVNGDRSVFMGWAWTDRGCPAVGSEWLVGAARRAQRHETMPDLVGLTLGHYRILSRIGQGGMGVVYRAHDDRLDRDVAIKVLPEEVAADPDRLARFEREARAVARLDHPHILAIHDFGTEDDVMYAVTELLEGETLRQRMSEGGLPWRTVAEIGVAVAEGLAAAHARGVVHRDLKPENVFLTTGGRVKILDFGLARFVPPVVEEAETATFTPTPTAAGTVLGTLGYMSPEQARGEAVDGRSDIFSLGCLLYEMLCGRPPFVGSTAAGTLAALLRDDPPPVPGVDAKVARLVERCLRKDVADRFPSAAELKSAIEASLAPGAPRERPSVAVLPFANMSGTKEDDYLCEGLAEEIINALTGIPGLRVIARTSAFAVGRMGLDVREAGARLDVDSLLEGSVRRAGARVRVTAQLVATSDGGHLWSERFDRELTDVLALEDEIAAAIAGRLRAELREEERSGRRTEVDAEAHGLYLEGRYYFARGTPPALAQARSCFEHAIERDPGFALAFDSLAELYWYLGFFGNVPPREAFAQSTWHALRAVELDDTLAESHALLGMLRKELDYNWPEVDRELHRARELNPESPLVRLRYAISGLLPRARIDEAAAEIDAMLRSDPLSVFVRWWAAIMAYLGRRWPRMIDEGRHMIALDPTQFFGHWAVGLACLETGAPDEAVRALEKAHELSGGIPFTLGFLAYVMGRAGRGDTCALLERAEAAAAKAYVPPSTLALGYVGLGDWDAAFEWWSRAIEARDPLIMPVKTYPFFDTMRADLRYRAMLRRMNLAED
jgi:serine/threonine protein kinase/tetratricopeptide (TPR) repeat protein